jgi:NhaA family Na+:H+ antiporter
MLGGIGFTMSIFITILAFKDSETIVFSKIAILIASVLSGILGFAYLKYILSKKRGINLIFSTDYCNLCLY